MGLSSPYINQSLEMETHFARNPTNPIIQNQSTTWHTTTSNFAASNGAKYPGNRAAARRSWRWKWLSRGGWWKVSKRNSQKNKICRIHWSSWTQTSTSFNFWNLSIPPLILLRSWPSTYINSFGRLLPESLAARPPQKKDRLPTSIFQGRTVKLRGVHLFLVDVISMVSLTFDFFSVQTKECPQVPRSHSSSSYRTVFALQASETSIFLAAKQDENHAMLMVSCGWMVLTRFYFSVSPASWPSRSKAHWGYSCGFVFSSHQVEDNQYQLYQNQTHEYTWSH